MKYHKVNGVQSRRTETKSINDSNFVVKGKSEVQYSSVISWKKEKNSMSIILIVRIKKDRSNLEPHVEDSFVRLQSLFEAEIMISKNLNEIILRLSYSIRRRL